MRTMCTATNPAIQAPRLREEMLTLLTKPRRVGSGWHAGRKQSRAPRAQRRRALRPAPVVASFSAVSKPNFASKYSLESSWRDLQDLHAFAPLSNQNFSLTSSMFFAFSQFYFQNSRILMKILRNFSSFYGKDKNLLDVILKFPEISQRKLSNFSENDFAEV